MPDKSVKGVYILLIELTADRTIRAGGLGKILFPRGFYAYVGSAMNGLNQRISRHLRKDKLNHWHIDYLTDKAKIRDVLTLETDKKLECVLARKLARELKSTPGFGASDCKCESHLFFAPEPEELKSKVVKAIQSLGTEI